MGALLGALPAYYRHSYHGDRLSLPRVRCRRGVPEGTRTTWQRVQGRHLPATRRSERRRAVCQWFLGSDAAALLPAETGEEAMMLIGPDGRLRISTIRNYLEL